MRAAPRWSLVAPLVAVLAAAPSLAAQCPEGRSPGGDLGIERYRCVGGVCAIWSRHEGGLAHVFTTEPRLDRLDPAGPAVGLLREGDVLVSVDELLVTTAAGGARLANLEPGVPVGLWIRRGGRALRVEVTPVRGCGPRGLTVRPGPGR